MNGKFESIQELGNKDPAWNLVASDKYVPQLDGIRAIAVSIVVFAHYHIMPIPGGFGVTLFFFLSGYLITTLFFAEMRLNSRINIPQFYLRRWLRLTPPLILSCAVGVLFYHFTRTFVGGQPVPTGTVLAALLYYTNYYDLSWSMDPDKVIPFGICWSLAVEEHFYLIWPWILRRIILRPNILCLFVAVCCALVLGWRIIAHDFLGFSIDYTGIATDTRIDSILYGALLRIIFETAWRHKCTAFFKTWTCRLLSLAALASTFAIRNDAFRETFRYTVQGLALMPIFTLVLFANSKTLVSRALSSRPMVLLGKMSYSIYLFHLMSRTPAEVYFGSPFYPQSVASGLLLTLVVAYTTYIFVERPMAKLRHRFRGTISKV